MEAPSAPYRPINTESMVNMLASTSTAATTVMVPPPPTLTSSSSSQISSLNRTRMELQAATEQKRRSSSRSIKRKRFDDEIVEYSIGFPQNRGENNHRVGRPRTTSLNHHVLNNVSLPLPPPLLPQLPATVVSSTAVPISTSLQSFAGSLNVLGSSALSTLPLISQTEPLLVMGRHAPSRRPRTTSRRSRRSSGRPSNQFTTKDLGRWKPIDDLALILGIQQTNDMRVVHRGVKFSCKFTLQEIQSRWLSLLYEPAISRIAVAAMRNLHPELIESVQRDTLFSAAEEDVLGTLKSGDNPKLEQFQELLDQNAGIFFSSRTPHVLQNHWLAMKQFQLLPDQSVKSLHVSDQPLSFSDAEDGVLDAELNEQRDEALDIELALTDHGQKRIIRVIENELGRWNVLVDSIAPISVAPEFDGQTLAVLRGRLVRYLMRSKEITFGRDAKDGSVDVDLSLEGSATKISRRQGSIKLRSNGDFFIANEGKRPLFIDGEPLVKGNKMRLANNCVIEIAGLRFVFLVNYELINAIRHESAKTNAPLN